MATAVKVIQLFLVCAYLLGLTPAVEQRHGRKRGRCLVQSEMSGDSLTRAPCHPNPCKEKWIADETSKTIGSCENHWSCCSQDDQCVTSVLNCTLQNTNSTDLAPRCDYHGVSVMPNNCDITIDISNFDSRGTTSIILAIEYNYNCSEQHYCHSICKGYRAMKSRRRSGTHSRDVDGDWSADHTSEDEASRYCSISDKDTFKQTMTLQILFPKPQLTLSECSNCICNDSDGIILQASMNCNIIMTCLLGLDGEEVENTWIYFRFHQKNTGRIITANCEPRKKERNVNYNWEIYRDENFDCKLEIPNAGEDDIGNYECGILEVTHVNSVNSVAKSQARNFMIFDEPMQGPRCPNFPVGTVVGPAVGGVVLAIVILIVASVMGWLIKGQKKRQEEGLRGEQEGGQHGELGADVGERQHFLPEDREQGYGGTGEQRQPVGIGDGGGHDVGDQQHLPEDRQQVHGLPAAPGDIQVGGRGAAQEHQLVESGDSGDSGRSDVYWPAMSFVHDDAPAVDEVNLTVEVDQNDDPTRIRDCCKIL